MAQEDHLTVWMRWAARVARFWSWPARHERLLDHGFHGSHGCILSVPSVKSVVRFNWLAADSAVAAVGHEYER